VDYPSGAVFTSPPSPMLAQLDARLPQGERWAYEPKMDGFRGLLWRRDGATQLLSRSGRDLGPWFPELITAAESLPCNTLVDGEIVIADESGLADFGALQQRLTLARKFIGQAVASRAAILLVFDVLELEGEELTTFPLSDRRRVLEQLLAHGHRYLQVVSHTLDVQVAEAWLGVPGLEGVVAKRVDRPYVAGRGRDWVKVKRQRTIECAVVGVTGDLSAPRLVLGLRHDDGRLHHFAVSRPISVEDGGPLATLLAEAGPAEAAIKSRWQHDAVPPWRRVEPKLVCEVRVTNLDLGRWARFPVAFVRWRPDRSPDDCALDQLSS
jgi:ATP-dependent DNA ligase